LRACSISVIELTLAADRVGARIGMQRAESLPLPMTANALWHERGYEPAGDGRPEGRGSGPGALGPSRSFLADCYLFQLSDAHSAYAVRWNPPVKSSFVAETSHPLPLAWSSRMWKSKNPASAVYPPPVTMAGKSARG